MDIQTNYTIELFRISCIFWYIISLILTKNKVRFADFWFFDLFRLKLQHYYWDCDRNLKQSEWISKLGDMIIQ